MWILLLLLWFSRSAWAICDNNPPYCTTTSRASLSKPIVGKCLWGSQCLNPIVDQLDTFAGWLNKTGTWTATQTFDAGASNSLVVTPTGSPGGGLEAPTDGAVLITNTASTDVALQIYSNQGAAMNSPLMLIQQDNPAADDGALRIIQNGTSGAAYHIRLDGRTPQIEMVETDQVAPNGKFEIGVNGNDVFIDSRNAADTSFEEQIRFPRMADGGGFRLYEFPPSGGLEWSWFHAGAQSANITYTLPTALVAGLMQVNGSGVMSWTPTLTLDGGSTPTIRVTPTGNPGTGNEAPTDGAVVINNTGSTDIGLQVYSDQGATTNSPLVLFRADNVAYDDGVLRVMQDGTSYTIQMEGASPRLRIVESDQATPAGRFETGVNGDAYYVASRDAADANFENSVVFPRLASGGGLQLLEPSGSGTNFTAFKTQAQAANLTYTLPATQTANGLLTNNGSGTLTWQTTAALDGVASPALTVTPTGSPGTGNEASTDGAVVINNTGSTDIGLQVYTDQGAATNSPLVLFRSDNAAFDDGVLRVIQDGTSYTQQLEGPSPSLRWVETDQTTPLGKFVLGVNGNTVYIGSRDGADSAFENSVEFPRLTSDGGGIRLYEPSGSGTNTTTFQVPALASNLTYILPASSAAGPLVNNGSNTLSWGIAPTAQTITNTNTVLANACGGVKRLTSSGAVTTSTTDTFAAPAAANAGCHMDVCNTGTFAITLDANTNFKTSGTSCALPGGDVVLDAEDCVSVVSDGVAWRQVGCVSLNN